MNFRIVIIGLYNIITVIHSLEARQKLGLCYSLTLGHGFSNENRVVITRTVTLGASGPRAFSVPHPHRSLCRRI